MIEILDSCGNVWRMSLREANAWRALIRGYGVRPIARRLATLGYPIAVALALVRSAVR